MNALSALDILKHTQSGDESDIKETIQCAISALEKQIPKKVLPYNNFENHCECGAIVKSYCKFCYECGQALDWSE
jgi:hypothetical protein